MASLPSIINKSIHGIGFGFLHDDEIKKLSVKQITNSQSFDSLRQPVIGGLYDRAYGPTDPFDTCDTCELGERECPGHPGHLQLAVPLYDIFLLELLIKLLNAKCWNCHHLRLSALKKKFVYAQLLYLNSSHILRAREVSELMNPTIFRKYDENTQSVESQLDDHIRKAQELNANASSTQSRLTFHVSRARNELIKSFMSQAKTANGRCQNCGACSPAVRRDGFTKIFVQSLNSRQRTHNDKIGVRIHSIMSKSQYDNETFTSTEQPLTPAQKLKQEKEKKAFARQQKKEQKREAQKLKQKKKKAEKDDDMSSSSDDDSDLDDLEDELIQGHDRDQAEDVFGESMHALAAQAKKAAEKEEIFAKINASTDVEETTSRLILPNEVERHMALLWGSNDSDILGMLFCPGTRQTVAANPYNGNDYRAFFHRVLLVPPSRFRPPRYVAGEFFESSTNVSYRKIFDSNEEIVRTVFQQNSVNNTTGAVLLDDSFKKLNSTAVSQDTESKLDKLSPASRKRVVDAWIAMQHELNLFYDSDKTGNHLVKGSGSAGIKQILEKKQGLFRKHMMGKRVNFAARSVISPDPYLHTREIGVPEIFATTLTFPEPVTAFNYQELRQAVINGPFIHPGANAVVTSKGREIKLATQTLEQRTALANSLLGNTEAAQGGNGGNGGNGKQRQRDVTNVEKNLHSELVGDVGPMTVLRHLRSGDVLLVNRQPTLHKPSMMAHVARVLFGENVIRMHYANCIAEGTLVDMADGSKIPIEQVKTGHQVVTWGAREGPADGSTERETCIPFAAAPGSELGAIRTVTKGEWSRGEQECFSMVLQDGRELVATADHRVLVALAAAKLATDTKFVTVRELMQDTNKWRVVCSALATGPKAGNDDFINSAFTLGGISYSTDKARVLALSRLIGHACAGGNLNPVVVGGKTVLYGCHYLGTWHDVASLLNDVKLVDPSANYSNDYQDGSVMGGAFRVSISGFIPSVYAQVGVQPGRRTAFNSTIPSFFGDVNTPLEVVRNFLAGFWGGNGASPTFTTSFRPESAQIPKTKVSDANSPLVQFSAPGVPAEGSSITAVYPHSTADTTPTKRKTQSDAGEDDDCDVQGDDSDAVPDQGIASQLCISRSGLVTQISVNDEDDELNKTKIAALDLTMSTFQQAFARLGCSIRLAKRYICDVSSSSGDVDDAQGLRDTDRIFTYCPRTKQPITSTQSLVVDTVLSPDYVPVDAAELARLVSFQHEAQANVVSCTINHLLGEHRTDISTPNLKRRHVGASKCLIVNSDGKIIPNPDKADELQVILNERSAYNLTKAYYRVDFVIDVGDATSFTESVPISYSVDKIAKWNLFIAYRNFGLDRREVFHLNPDLFPNFMDFLRESSFEWRGLDGTNDRAAAQHSFSLGVKSIKSVGVKKVYDLNVDGPEATDGNHTFVAGGVVVHNCNTYNADFDGDEMNLHFPQNQLARIEAYDIANNDNQYIVPTSGNPLRGLIQDHVVCGVRLTSRDCFLNREYFHQFLFLAIADRDVQNGNMIVTPQPAILKPRPLWTGKQIINNILDFVAEHRPPLNLAPTKAKVPGSSWGKQGEEDGLVVIRENKLVQGVLDKAMFGASKHGLVHAVYELYGAKAAGNILTIFARLFTRVLQYDAFTCGIEDFLLTHDVDVERRVAIEQSVWDGVSATATCAGLEGDVKTFGAGKINEAVQRMYAQHKSAGEMLDNAVKAALSQNTSNIIKLCIPNGQRIPFPRNNMAMMTLSGAKGSAVNHSQIACLLGQQELEGRRVPLTMAGKTLPSFPRYDPQPRAGGYISQRFFTGIRPQEFYFHCMSGREGLVDTAVKTARSGYLQRCLIKLLEGLTIKYDNTVRDVDGSVVQFQYGEDGIDPVKAGYLTTLPFLASNFNPLMSKLNPFEAIDLLDDTSVDDYRSKIEDHKAQLDDLQANHARLTKKEDDKLKDLSGSKKEKELQKIVAKRTERELAVSTAKEQFELLNSGANDPVLSKFPIGKTLGAVSDKYRDQYMNYIKSDPDGVFANSELMQTRWTGRLDEKTRELNKKNETLKTMKMSSSASKSKVQIIQDQIRNLQEQIDYIQTKLDNVITPEKFIVLMNLYYMHNLAHPGENVGVIAGQSVGEPSTQMTLNTFHLAGHGGANVTLGIPRLREIVMTASDHISTPIMELPLKNPSPEAAIKLAAKLNKVKLSECLQSVSVQQTITDSGSRKYKIRLNLKDLESDWALNNLVTPYNIAKCVSIEFARKLQTAVQARLRRADAGVLSSRVARSHGEIMTSAEEDTSIDDLDNDDLAGELDSSERRKMRDLEEGLSQGKKKQQTSYEGDSDDDDDDEEEEEKEDEEVGKKKHAKKSKKSDMDDIDSYDSSDNDEGSDDTDDSSDDDDDDDDEEETMTDSTSTKKTVKKTTKKTTKAEQPKLVSEFELSQIQSNADFSTFCRRLVPYWGRHHYIENVQFNMEEHYIDIVVVTPQGSSKLLMLSTVDSLCDVCRVRYTDGINKAIAIDRKLGDGRKVKIVQTDGVNLQVVANIDEIDHANIKTNDIHRILKTYGVEAASNSIKGEISGVFAVYGIVVDPRHLSLIADFMTFQGGYHAMNRNAMGSRPSVLQKATFETSLRFILDACQSGEFDHLTSPSSSIVIGKPIQSGTGTFELRHPLPNISPQ
jgi:DNA-directed RNA polymerase I subunit RPA1